MPKIFISYRRSDSDYVTAAIASKLSARFGKRSLFMDVDTIPLGHDFRESIRLSLAACDIAIVVIGKQWLEAGGVLKSRRIDEETDFVRIEVEAVLNRGIPVIPLLISGATMPQPNDLPPSIVELAYRQAIEIRPGRDFDRDLQRLVESLSRERRGTLRKKSPIEEMSRLIRSIWAETLEKFASTSSTVLHSLQKSMDVRNCRRMPSTMDFLIFAYFGICSLFVCLGYALITITLFITKGV